MYTVTYAKGTSIHDETHYQRRDVAADVLGVTITGIQRRGGRIIRVELAA